MPSHGIIRYGALVFPPITLLGNVEKIRQRRSRLFAMLTHGEHALRVNLAVVLLGELF